MIVARTFSGDREMFKWLADSDAIVELHNEYPPPRYSAHADMAKHQIIVTDTKSAEAQ